MERPAGFGTNPRTISAFCGCPIFLSVIKVQMVLKIEDFSMVSTLVNIFNIFFKFFFTKFRGNFDQNCFHKKWDGIFSLISRSLSINGIFYVYEPRFSIKLIFHLFYMLCGGVVMGDKQNCLLVLQTFKKQFLDVVTIDNFLYDLFTFVEKEFQ